MGAAKGAFPRAMRGVMIHKRASALIVALCSAATSAGQPALGAAMPTEGGASIGVGDVVMAGASAQSRKARAQSYLARILPKATAANPRYRSGAGEELTAWLTQSVHFAPSPRGLSIAMSEKALVYRDGAQTAVNTHEAAFAITDVQILEYSYPSDTTEKGEKAIGILFKCKIGNCVHSMWNGAASDKAETDLSLNDSVARRRILRAFWILQAPAGGVGLR